MRLGRALRDLRPIGATAVTALAGYLVLLVVALSLGVLVTHVVVGGPLGRMDLEVARWFAHRRTGFRNDLSVVGSYLAETVTVVLVAGVLATVLAIRRLWALCGLLIVSLSLEALVYLASTFFISRNRPAVPRLEDLIVADSFPSGHTAASVVLYGCIGIIAWSVTRRPLLRALALLVVVVVPLIVATSRVYRGMHNPTDVLCGAVIGIGCIVVASFAVRVGESAAYARRDAPAPSEHLISSGANEAGLDTLASSGGNA